jgi:hypothetical protein
MSEKIIIEKTLNPSIETIENLISNGVNFEIEVDKGGRAQSEYIRTAEEFIEGKGLSCRVRLADREYALSTLAIPNPVSIGIAVFQAAHTLATFNPDWTINKHKFNKGITVLNNKPKDW